MSFFRRLIDRFGGDKEAAPAAPAPEQAQRPAPPPAVEVRRPEPKIAAADPIEGLARLGEVGAPGEQEALSILRAARGTRSEAGALHAILAAPAPPELVRIAAAELLSARGEASRALTLLARVTRTEGLVLAADLHAASGDLARALSSIERVLARDIESPGAKERRARFARSLGIGAAPARRVDEATLLTGRGTSAPYRILREAARGGAGTVYEAEDEVLARRVAFKVFHGEGADRSLVEREIRFAGELQGQGIVRFYDASPADGWVSLEWIGRGSLRDILARGQNAALFPIASWALPLARAIARIHAAGMVHLDVKPANVLLREPDDPVLTDFGLVRRPGQASSGGSAGYVAPERLAGEPVTFDDDVYGFGRIVEDVLQKSGTSHAGWSRVSLACLASRGERFADGAVLVRALLAADDLG